MGNSNSREGRGQGSPLSSGPSAQADTSANPVSTPSDRNRSPRTAYASNNRLGHRPDLSFLGIGSSSNNDVSERRETKQEREKRKLEKERAMREKEREQSIREEHVDGGYLVTMGVYTGIEDFSKAAVRQVMIERRIAPFWRGLDDFREDWAEHQLIAAARALEIPAADAVPSEYTSIPMQGALKSPDSNIQNRFGPSRTLSGQPEASPALLSPSHPALASSSPTLIPGTSSPTASSPFRPRAKPLAAVTKITSSTGMVPREIQLPRDPLVNGQALEVFLYKNAEECPICFLYYPPYLNKTRCCGQPICSECFVQIKRPDPHPPEHTDPSDPASPPESAAEAEYLVSEPAACPYCQAPEFGVTYEAPPFSRGLAYAGNGVGISASAMSSASSIATNGNGGAAPHTGRRRTTSISANADSVITTDYVRPDWSTKLATAKNHLARRSAAATALHTAAYIIGNGENRGFAFSNRSRFIRGQAGGSPDIEEDMSPSGDDGALPQLHSEGRPIMRRSRVEDLEEMMMMEAIRQSLAAEEERTRKADREAAKGAKKKAKEEKKQERRQEKKEKKERKSIYGSGNTSASGSALSLVLPGIGRRRNNSGGSNLARDPTPEAEESFDWKGKGVDQGENDDRTGNTGNASIRHQDTSTMPTYDSNQSTSSPTMPDRPSHLRNVSNVSSSRSSIVKSSTNNDPIGRGSSPGTATSNPSAVEGGSVDSELDTLFNYSSLAHMIGRDNDEETNGLVEYVIAPEGSPGAVFEAGTTALGTNDLHANTHNVQLMRQSPNQQQASMTPELVVTPVSPIVATPGEEESVKSGESAWVKPHANEMSN